MSYRKKLRDVGVVTGGSADAPAQNMNCDRNMRINQKLFGALVQHKMESSTNKGQEISIELKS